MSDEIEIRTSQIKAENLSVDVLIERIVYLELDVKKAEMKAEEGQVYTALQAVDLQKKLDPTIVDIDSKAFNELYESK